MKNSVDGKLGQETFLHNSKNIGLTPSPCSAPMSPKASRFEHPPLASAGPIHRARYLIMTDNVGWGAPVVDAIVAPVETQEAFLARRNHEIQSWLSHKEAKDAAVELERECRDKVTRTLFPAPKKGTQRYELSGGFKVKLVHGYTYTLGIKDMPNPDIEGETIPINKQVEDLQQAIHECGNQGPILADRLIRWKPELVASEYEKLDVEFADQKEIKAMIDALLTKKDASPQLTFEEPKAK